MSWRNAIALPRVIRKRTTTLDALARLEVPLGRVLNVGSRATGYGPECVNLDLVRFPGVHLRGDAHALPFDEATFDTCVLSAVLQYCRHPDVVVAEVHRVLRPGGHVVVDAPFVQPYCPETAAHDLWRFTDRGLRALFAPRFAVLACETSIAAGSALAYATQQAAGAGEVRYVSFALQALASLLVWPLGWWRPAHPGVAGAFVLVGRKAGMEAPQLFRLTPLTGVSRVSSQGVSGRP